ncbi:MAG: tetratricopeptide repeat protein [Planctomycetales bacterium]
MRRVLVIVCLLAAATLAVYAQSLGHGFVNFDDPTYVAENPRVARGPTLDDVRWAFTTTHFANWHPLTWLSYMLDAGLFLPERGTIYDAAGGFHATNVALHLANVLLLFFVLRRLTGADWKSAAVAGLFAVHPLHVESVAWVSERKDVLSLFFGLLALGAYARFAMNGGRTWYAAALVAFAASLMSKQMLVTLPFVLILLDWWPLGRIRDWSPSPPRFPATPQRRPPRILAEKVPFLALSLAASVVAVMAQRAGGTLQSIEAHSLRARMLNAVVAYALYLAKAVWPVDLIVYYTHPGESISTEQVAIAGAVLAALSGLCLWGWRRMPFLAVGWLWFLGTLVPVIGLVQVGGQQMADRYMYFPAIGLYLAGVWLAAVVCQRFGELRIVHVTAAAAAFVVLGTLAWIQTGHWRDSETLYRHALAVDERNGTAHGNLAVHYFEAARSVRDFSASEAARLQDAALVHAEEAVRLEPADAQFRYHLGRIQLERGSPALAIHQLAEAARIKPHDKDVQLALGLAYRRLSDAGGTPPADANSRAIEHYRRALDLDPDFQEARVRLTTALLDENRLDEAEEQLEIALRSAPVSWETHLQLVVVMVHRGDDAAARHHAREAGRLNPRLPDPETLLRRARKPAGPEGK